MTLACILRGKLSGWFRVVNVHIGAALVAPIAGDRVAIHSRIVPLPGHVPTSDYTDGELARRSRPGV